MNIQTFHFTSHKFEGIVVLQYNENGQKVNQDLTGANLSAQLINWFNRTMPNTLSEFQQQVKGQKGVELKRVDIVNVTFDTFWDKYDDKARSSKKKTERIWDRMSQKQRDRAYYFIDTYLRRIPPGIAKKYASTYLNDELWNN